MAKKIVYTLILLSSHCIFAYTPSFHFLVLPYSSMEAIFGAATGTMPLVDALPENPAANPAESSFALSLSYRRHLAHADLYSFIGWKRLRRFCLSILFKNVVISEIEKRDTPTEEPDFVFSTHQISVGINISYSLTKWLRFGAGMIHAYEDIDFYHHSTTIFNLGTLFQTSSLGLGLSVINLGGEERTKREIYHTPIKYNSSLFYRVPFKPFNKRVSLSLGFSKPDYAEGEVIGGLGYEYRFLFIFASYNKSERLGKLSFGALIRKGMMNFAYAVTPYGESFSWGHHITFAVSR